MSGLEAIVKAVGPNADACGEASIGVGQLLGELGMVPELFDEWTRQYGADCLGVSPVGETMLPGFPVLSSLAWVDVDPVVIGMEKLSSLVDECDRLIGVGTSSSVSSDCLTLRALALCALAKQLLLEFDGT
jgi:hypothetical protein